MKPRGAGVFCWDCLRNKAEKKSRPSLPACSRNQACLNDPDFKLCPVEHCVMHKLIYIKCLENRDCVFRTVVEGSTICTCPVRKEIYNRTGK